MNPILTAVITTACTVITSLVVTFLFNKLSGMPKKLKEEKRAREQKIEDMERENTTLRTKVESLDTTLRELVTAKTTALSVRLGTVEEAVGHYPEYRAQSLQIQEHLQQTDRSILEACTAIKEDVVANRQMLDLRLKNLEDREKNSLRDKIYKHWRNFTSTTLNPMQTWTDMEQHTFMALVRDYESLGGNDYVHKVILPDMAKLRVISYEHDLDAVKALFASRHTPREDFED